MKTAALLSSLAFAYQGRHRGVYELTEDTCERVGAQILSLGAAFRGLAGGFDGAAATAQERGSALAHGRGRGGRVVLPLARAAAVSTGLRVRAVRRREAPREVLRHLG